MEVVREVMTGWGKFCYGVLSGTAPFVVSMADKDGIAAAIRMPMTGNTVYLTTRRDMVMRVFIMGSVCR
jgi:hypothetical protein